MYLEKRIRGVLSCTKYTLRIKEIREKKTERKKKTVALTCFIDDDKSVYKHHMYVSYTRQDNQNKQNTKKCYV